MGPTRITVTTPTTIVPLLLSLPVLPLWRLPRHVLLQPRRRRTGHHHHNLWVEAQVQAEEEEEERAEEEEAAEPRRPLLRPTCMLFRPPNRLQHQ